MLISRNLHIKSSEVLTKKRWTATSLSFKDQATKPTTVKWSIGHFRIVLEQMSRDKAERTSLQSPLHKQRKYKFVPSTSKLFFCSYKIWKWSIVMGISIINITLEEILEINYCRLESFWPKLELKSTTCNYHVSGPVHRWEGDPK